MKRPPFLPFLSVGLICLASALTGCKKSTTAESKPAEVAEVAETKPADAPNPVESPPAEVVEFKGALALLPSELVNAEGAKVSRDSLKGKMVGLYFSAHWCGPCRRFTPDLVAFRDAHTADFEVVFVSSDKTAEAMKGYMTEAKMQWPAVPYGDPAMKAIKQHFAIRGIPSLIILGPDGQVISKEGRGDVSRLKDGAIAAWKDKAAAPAPAAAPTAAPTATPPATP